MGDENNKKTGNFTKKYGLPNPCRKIKISSKIKTLDDLLARSDVNDTLDGISRLKPDIVKVLVIYETTDHFINYKVSGESVDVVETLGMIEYVKDMLLHPDSEDEDEN